MERLDFARELHHIRCMTSKKPKPPKEGTQQVAKALAGWEDEGGASQPKSENNQHRGAALVVCSRSPHCCGRKRRRSDFLEGAWRHAFGLGYAHGSIAAVRPSNRFTRKQGG